MTYLGWITITSVTSFILWFIFDMIRMQRQNKRIESDLTIAREKWKKTREKKNKLLGE